MREAAQRHVEAGLQKLFKQFSFPGGIPSHASPETPGSIHEGEPDQSTRHPHGRSRRAVEIVKQRIETGTLFEVIEAESRLLATESDVVQSETATVTKLTVLYKALGEDGRSDESTSACVSCSTGRIGCPCFAGGVGENALVIRQRMSAGLKF